MGPVGVLAVSIVYRIVPNTHIPLRVLAPPAIAGGLILTVLTQALVDIEPLLAGALSIFGGVAAVFVALAWLHLAFQVLLLGASWTRLRLDEARARGEA
jgi:membrane protein